MNHKRLSIGEIVERMGNLEADIEETLYIAEGIKGATVEENEGLSPEDSMELAENLIEQTRRWGKVLKCLDRELNRIIKEKLEVE